MEEHMHPSYKYRQGGSRRTASVNKGDLVWAVSFSKELNIGGPVLVREKTDTGFVLAIGDSDDWEEEVDIRVSPPDVQFSEAIEISTLSLNQEETEGRHITVAAALDGKDRVMVFEAIDGHGSPAGLSLEDFREIRTNLLNGFDETGV